MHRLVLLLAIFTACLQAGQSAPHIILAVADDLGWADVSYHGGAIPTPTIDSLSARGVRLERHYTAPLCTPSRMALLTGRSSHLSGFGSGGVLLSGAPFSLPDDADTLPRALRRRGYATAMVGKWHLGSSRKRDLPTGERWGFDTWLGCLQGAGGHYSKAVVGPQGLASAHYDFARSYACNGSFAPEVNDEHTTRVITAEAVRVMQQHAGAHPQQPLFLYLPYTAVHTPLQAEPDWQRRCQHIDEGERRDLCALVVGLDEALANVTAAARATLGDDVVVAFMSDNGGSFYAGSSNAPLRGGKFTSYEGGVRCVAFVTDTSDDQRYLPANVSYHGLAHIADWMPTLLAVASSQRDKPAQPTPPLGHGYDLYPALVLAGSSAATSPRSDAVLALDDNSNFVAYLRPPYKLLVGFAGPDWQLSPDDSAAPPPLPLRVERWLRWLFDWYFGTRDMSFYWQEFLHMLVVSFWVADGHFASAGEQLLGSADSGDVLASRRLAREQIPVRVFDVWSDPEEHVDLSASRPDLVASLLHSFSPHWQQRPPQQDWSLVCPTRSFVHLPQHLCEARTSDQYPEMSRRGLSRHVPCRFDAPFVDDDDPSPCGNGQQPVNAVKGFFDAIAFQLCVLVALLVFFVASLLLLFVWATISLCSCRAAKN